MYEADFLLYKLDDKCTRFVLTSSGLKLAGRLAELYLHINKVEKR